MPLSYGSHQKIRSIHFVIAFLDAVFFFLIGFIAWWLGNSHHSLARPTHNNSLNSGRKHNLFQTLR